MLNQQQAAEIVKKNLPGAKINKIVEDNKIFLFLVTRTDPGEEDMDPFFSVDKNTGEFRDFSILEDGTEELISKLSQ